MLPSLGVSVAPKWPFEKGAQDGKKTDMKGLQVFWLVFTIFQTSIINSKSFQPFSLALLLQQILEGVKKKKSQFLLGFQVDTAFLCVVIVWLSSLAAVILTESVVFN